MLDIMIFILHTQVKHMITHKITFIFKEQLDLYNI